MQVCGPRSVPQKLVTPTRQKWDHRQAVITAELQYLQPLHLLHLQRQHHRLQQLLQQLQLRQLQRQAVLLLQLQQLLLLQLQLQLLLQLQLQQRCHPQQCLVLQPALQYQKIRLALVFSL